MRTSIRRTLVFALGFFACAGLWLSAIFAMPRPDLQPIEMQAVAAPHLPDAVRLAVEKFSPNGTISEVGLERRVIQFYEVTLIENNRIREMTVTADGTIMEIEELVDPETLRPEVRDAMRDITSRGSTRDIEWVEVRAEYKAVPLATPRYEYEIELIGKGPQRDVRLSTEGDELSPSQTPANGTLR